MADSADYPRRTVLVLGAAGFVGSRLVQTLADSVAFRPIAAPHRLRRSGAWPDVEVRICDATRPDALAAIMHDVDYVVNCIAGRSMVAASEALCAVARRSPPRRIVHLSSMAVYGGATGVVDEATMPMAPLNRYARAKRASEEIVQAYVRDGGDAVILRPACIYGPGSEQWTGRLARLLRAGRIGDLGAAGDGICNLTYIDDLVVAILSTFMRPDLSGAVFNVAQPEISWNEYLIRFARALGATPVQRLSERRIALEWRVIAPVLEMARRTARVVRLPVRLLPEPITPSLVRLWRQDIRLDTRRAAAQLDLLQTPLERGLAASARWFAGTSEAAERSQGAHGDGAMEIGQR